MHAYAYKNLHHRENQYASTGALPGFWKMAAQPHWSLGISDAAPPARTGPRLCPLSHKTI